MNKIICYWALTNKNINPKTEPTISLIIIKFKPEHFLMKTW